VLVKLVVDVAVAVEVKASASDGKVRFSLVQRPFCPNPEQVHRFSSAVSPDPKPNPWFRFKRVQFRFGKGLNAELNAEPFLGGA
jgi:hypothetical protein